VGLNAITIPDNVNEIGDYAFGNCAALTSVNIPQKCVRIGTCAFIDCSNLTGIWVDKNNIAYSSDQYGVLYNKDQTELIAAPCLLNVSNYYIPFEVDNICAYAFKNNKNLRSVSIMQIRSIGLYAFAYCESLYDVSINGEISEIDSSIFYNCKKLTNITITSGITRVSFSGCPNIKYNVYDNAKYLGNRTNPYVLLVSSNSKNIASCDIHSDTVAINSGAFQNCTVLTGILIGEKVKSIGSYAFRGCTNLASVAMFDGVTSIGDYAFASCSSLTDLAIPNGVTSVGTGVVNGCEKLQLNIYDNGEYIGNDENPYMVLLGATSRDITTCTIHPNTRIVCGLAFAGCRKLSSINIPNNVIMIGDSAFAQCAKLVSIVIGDSVTLIDDLTFVGCAELISIVLPNNLTVIGNQAFDTCKKLATVYYKGTLLEANNIAIGEYYNDSLTTATWHYECSDSVFGGQLCLYCPECNNYFMSDGSVVKATIIFKDWDGTILSCNTYCYREEVVVPTNPARNPDAVYTYTFKGWNKEITDCVDDETYIAIYTATYTDYTVTFKNWDGTILSAKTYHYGDKVTIPADPMRAVDEKYIYTFAGWDKVVVACDGDATYTATYTTQCNHSYQTTITKPSCTLQGYTTHTCANCGDTYKDTYVDAIGHKDGNADHVCDNGCGIFQGIHADDNDADHKCDYGCGADNLTAHSYASKVTAPTCVDKGYTTHTCACGDTYTDGEVVATGHKDNNKDHICDNGCGAYQGVHADGNDADHKCDYGCGQDNMTAHSYTSTVAASTCENKGYTTHTCACGDSYTDSEVVATGHKDANRDHICDNGCGMYQGTHADGNDADHLCDYGCGTIASEHSYQSVVTSPTCTEKGYTTHTCACGHSYVDAEKNALGHNYAAWYEIVAPTCTTEGTQQHDCSRCDHYETQAISAKGHNYQTIVTMPTCTDRGYTTHTCACGDRYVDSYVAATGHKDNNKDHICDNACGIYQGVHADGNDADHKCDYGCGEDHMTDHSYSAVVTAPTCENRGFTTYTCVCGDTYTANEVAAKGHTEVIDAAIAATCTKTGMTEGKHCSVCKKILVAQKTTQALGHKPGASATCTTAQSCTVCHTELVAAKGHKDQNSDYVCDTCDVKLCVNHVTEVMPAKEATCEQNGLTAGKRCSLCGEILEQQEIISAKGHTYTDVVTAPSCIERGFTMHTCHCGDQYADNYVAALGHKDDDKDHVCENGCGIYQGTHVDGNDADHKCDYGCGTDNLTSHQYDAVVTAPDCTNQGYTSHTCVCGHSYTDSYVAALDHEWDNATCEHVETCQNCGATRGQLADHNFGEWIEVQSPTVDEYGTAERMCKTCGKTEQKQLDKLQVQPTVPTEPSNPQDTKPTEPTEPSHTQGTKPTAPTQTGNPQGSKDAGENDGVSIVVVIVLAALCAAAGVATGVVIAKKKQ
jgi:hypothetical protein